MLKYKLFFLCYLCLIFFSCATIGIDKSDEYFRQGDFLTSANQITERQTNRGRNQVLYSIIKANLLQYAGLYEESIDYFLSAYNEIEDRIDIKLLESSTSYVLNDYVKSFYGETHEQLYISVLNSINFLMLRKFEGALVESKRAYNTHQVFNLDSALLNFVYALSSDILNEQNSALIEYNKLYEKGIRTDFVIRRLFLNASYSGNFSLVNELREKYSDLLQTGSPDEKYLIVFMFTGRSPIKIENSIIVDEIKFSVPQYKRFNNQIKYANIRFSYNDDAQEKNKDIRHYNSVLLDDINKMSEQVLGKRMKNIILRETIRTSLKASIFDQTAKKKEEEGASFLRELLKGVMMVTQFADLRCWYTLPAYISVIPVIIPASKSSINNLSVRFYNENNALALQKNYGTIDLPHKYNFLILSKIY